MPSLGELIHPVPLLAVALLLVNDHLLKGAGVLPGWLTGKLSDFAGLLFFPLLLTATYRTGRWLARKRDVRLTPPMLRVALAVTAAGFTALKISPAIAAAAGAIADPTDLAALVMLVPAWLLGRREIARGTNAT